MSSPATGALRLPWTASRPAPYMTVRDDGDEALARRAAAGDGAAFATLYDRYERKAYNLCYRITGSAEDAADATQETFVAVLERLPRLEGRDLNFASYLMTAARNASYDALARRKRVTPGEIPESAVPLGSGEDPDRPESSALRSAHQEQIRAANESLPPRQREVLALRELEELSYDDVAEIMGMNRNSVAQLISRARINLRDNLRQTALGSVAAASPVCDEALPLLAMRQDGALDDDTSAAWLAGHLTGCGTCRVRLEAMEEAGVAYRLWVPLVPALWLRGEAIAHAAERVGADWSAAARPRGRHLRLATAAGAVLVIAFLLVLADRAATPTREVTLPEAPTPAGAPVEWAAKPVAEPVRRKRAAKPVAKQSVERHASPAAPVEISDGAVPVAALVPHEAPVQHVRRAPQRRQAPPADTAPEPVVAEPAPEPTSAPDPVTEPPPPPPAEDPVTETPCPTATAVAGCPPPQPPPTGPNRIVAVPAQPTAPSIRTTTSP